MAIGMKDPVLGPSVMLDLHRSIHSGVGGLTESSGCQCLNAWSKGK